MHEHFNKYLNVEELIRRARPQLVVELGAGSGENTRQLLTLCKELDARLIVFSDGSPPSDLAGRLDWRWELSYLGVQELLEDSIDVAIIDTDHNSWTVDREIGILSTKMRPSGLVLLHDTESFAESNGYMTGYSCGERYQLEKMMEDERGYGQAVRSWIGRGFDLVRETKESAGAMALRRVVLV